VFALFGLGAIMLGPWLGRQADRRGPRDIAIVAALPIIVFAAVYWLEAPRPILYAASIAAGAGITGVSASWYALLSDATDGGRHGRRFGTVAALGNLGIILGATLTAQLWESFDEVGVGFVIAGVSVAICAAAFTSTRATSGFARSERLADEFAWPAATRSARAWKPSNAPRGW
jgi:MFS family permease